MALSQTLYASLLIFVALLLEVQSDPLKTKCNAPVVNAKENGIDDQYIVVMNDDAGDDDIDSVYKSMESSGAKVSYRWKGNKEAKSNKFRGFSMRVNGQKRAATLRKVRRNCGVKYIEQDQYAKVAACSSQSNAGWCLARIPQQSSQYIYPSSAGSGASVYVIDTGCNYTHPDLNGRITGIANFARETEPSDWDLNGHGTATVSLVGGRSYGAAKSAKLYCLKAMNKDGSGSYSDIIEAVNFAANRADKGIISMSLGGGYSSALNSAVQNAYANGHLPIVAAGNENKDTSYVSPASARNAVTVASSDESNKMASFSNYGQYVDIIAPGVACNVARAQNNGLGQSSGTSISTPLVAGVAAVIQTQFGWLSASDAPQKITNTLLSAAKTGVVGSMKPNTVNKLLYWYKCD